MMKKNLYHFFLICISLFCLQMKQAFCSDSIITGYASDKIYSYLSIGEDDIKHYKHIFKALEKEDFEEADDEVEELNNDILMGHVLAQKYLSKSYKTSYEELDAWLKKYGDHPQTNRIKRLAAKKNPKGKRTTATTQISRHRAMPNTDLSKMKTADRNFVLKNYNTFRRALNKGKTKVARNALENKRFRRLVKNRDLDSLAATLAMKYLTDNYNKQAFEWASKAALRSQDISASWIAGLAAWRMKQYKTAATYFEKTANSKNNDEWVKSAGAYWAYRARMRLKQEQKAYANLAKAAKYKRTFYGILAAKKLNLPIEYQWTLFSYLNDFSQDDYINQILASASLKRAILLLHARQRDLAEEELRYDYKNMNDKQKEVALFIANQYKMHALAILLSNQLKDDENNIAYDVLSYPIPSWKPKDGWKVDKALILALTRQESSFRPQAKSPAGACGLMQLLPSTAAHITKNRSLRKNNTPLLEAEYNMAVGQRYVHYLLEKDYINGNLFYMMTAYNAGPGNLLKWEKKANYNDDPLLFIEVIPARETRLYIERVMANYWIYQTRFEQELTGIDALINGQWPMLDKK